MKIFSRLTRNLALICVAVLLFCTLTLSPTARFLVFAQPQAAQATRPSLGTANNFAVLGASAVTNTGTSLILNDIGVSPGTSVTGFPPGIVTGTTHIADATAQQAQNDVAVAYGDAAGQGCNSNLTGQDLGGKTLTPGVYCFSSAAQLTGQLNLNGQGNAASVFIFQIGSTFTTASNANVFPVNGTLECNVFWEVGSSATLGTNSYFSGNILALTSITAMSGVTSNGSLYAHTGAVTLDGQTLINSPCAGPPVATQTPTPTPISTPTLTPTSTSTPTLTPTSTPTSTPTVTPTAISTQVVPATQPPLGTASNFAILAASAVNSTGLTRVSGDIGTSSGKIVTGFPPGIVTGMIHIADTVAQQAQHDETNAYANAAGQPCDFNLTGQNLGGKILTPGVYCFSSSAQLTGSLTLDGQGNPASIFIFQIAGNLTTANNASVLPINGAQACNITWQVGNSATLGTGNYFAGNILALNSITSMTGTRSNGGLYSQNGTVTLDPNTLARSPCAVPMPIPTETPTATPALTDTPTPTVTPAPTATITAVPTSISIQQSHQHEQKKDNSSNSDNNNNNENSHHNNNDHHNNGYNSYNDNHNNGQNSNSGNYNNGNHSHHTGSPSLPNTGGSPEL